MNTRNTILLLVLIAGLANAAAAARRTHTPSLLDGSPDVVVEEFYKWYIHAISHRIDPLKAGRTSLKGWATSRLIVKLDRIAKEMETGGFDGDYLLEAQRDYPDSPGLEEKWLQNISVSQPVIKNATATVMISFGDGDNGILAREKISLVKAGGVWKIDDVKGIYPTGSEIGHSRK